MSYRIIYVAVVSEDFAGQEQKITAQFDAFTALGADIFLLLVSSVKPGERLAHEISRRRNVQVMVNSPDKVKSPWSRRRQKFEMISAFLSSFDPKRTIVYLRYPLADFLFLRFLKQNVAFRIVTEHQELENKLRMGRISGNLGQDVLDLIWGNKVRSRIAGFVAISNQCLENQLSYLKSDCRVQKYGLASGNGIDTSKFQPRPFVPFDGKTLRILFVGRGFKYQGLHRLLASLDNYYRTAGAIKVTIHLVGVSLQLSSLARYLTNPAMRSSIVLHDYLAPSEIDRVAADCHMAVNSLSLHLIGMKESSTLKSKEYFARGIPFVSSSPDIDIANDCPYVMRVSADEKPFDIRSLIDFAGRMNQDPEHPEKMRQFAAEHLQWSVKIERLLAFFDQIMGETRSTQRFVPRSERTEKAE